VGEGFAGAQRHRGPRVLGDSHRDPSVSFISFRRRGPARPAAFPAQQLVNRNKALATGS
jgi:hypothetical protein